MPKHIANMKGQKDIRQFFRPNKRAKKDSESKPPAVPSPTTTSDSSLASNVASAVVANTALHIADHDLNNNNREDNNNNNHEDNCVDLTRSPTQKVRVDGVFA